MFEKRANQILKLTTQIFAFMLSIVPTLAAAQSQNSDLGPLEAYYQFAHRLWAECLNESDAKELKQCYETIRSACFQTYRRPNPCVKSVQGAMFDTVGRILTDRGIAAERVSSMIEATQGVCLDNLDQNEKSENAKLDFFEQSTVFANCVTDASTGSLQLLLDLPLMPN